MASVDGPTTEDEQERVGSGPPAWFWAVVAALTALAAWRHLGLPIPPPWDGGSIERLFIADQPPLRHLLFPLDARHPGLWPVLVHPLLRWSGHDPSWVHAFVRLCAVATVPLSGLLVVRRAGPWAAALAMLAVALLPPLGLQAQALTDTTLFAALAIGALWMADAALEGGDRVRGIGAGVLLGLALQTSYSALPVVLGLLGMVVVSRDARRRLGPGLVVSLVVASPAILAFLRRLPSEVAARQAPEVRAFSLWPGAPFGDFLREAAVELFGRPWTGATLGVAVVGLGAALGLGRARGVLWPVLAVYVAALPLQVVLPVRPYYLMMLPLLVVLALATSVQQRRVATGWGDVVLLGALLAIGAGFARHEWNARAERERMLFHPRWAPIEAAREEGGDTLFLAFEYGWAPAVFFFLDDPFATMRVAYDTPDAGDDQAWIDPGTGREVRILTSFPYREGWEQDAFAKLERRMADGPVHLLLDQRVLVPSLQTWVTSRCTRLQGNERLESWRCEGAGAPALPSRASPPSPTP